MRNIIPTAPNELIVWLAAQYIGSKIPYIYGGDDPLEGWDCSGFVHEVLQAVGYEIRGFDSTAHDMYLALLKADHIIDNKHAFPGHVIFYFRGSRAIHTGILITPRHMVHAGGGGRQTDTPEKAAEENAYLRVDLIKYRPESYALADPYGTPLDYKS